MPFVNREDRLRGALFVVYGIPGSGKTMLAAGLMKTLYERTGKPMIYADYEDGEISIPDGVPFQLWVPGTGDPLDEIEDLTQLAIKDDNISGLVVDTVSTLGDAELYSITEKELYAESGKETKRTQVRTAGGSKIIVPTLTDYNVGQLNFMQWILTCRQLLLQGKYVLLLAHENVVLVEDAKGAVQDVIGGPAVIGRKLTRTLPKVPHVAARLTIRQIKGRPVRWLQTDADGYYVARDRLRSLPSTGVPFEIPAGTPGDLGENIVARAKLIWDAILDARKAREAPQSTETTQDTPETQNATEGRTEPQREDQQPAETTAQTGNSNQ